MQPALRIAFVAALTGMHREGRSVLAAGVTHLAPAVLRLVSRAPAVLHPSFTWPGAPRPMSRPDIEASVHDLREEILAALVAHIRENGCQRKDIATRMGVTPGRVSQILSGHDNLTLRSIATLSAALRVQLRVRLEIADVGAVLGGSHITAGSTDLEREPPRQSRGSNCSTVVSTASPWR